MAFSHSRDIQIEICLDSVESVIAAQDGGADRVEFCSDLFEGGLTPTVGAFRIARRHAGIPLSVMIRPRGGDFCYSDLEFEVMLEDARIFKEEGADMLVFGMLTPEGDIDTERSSQLMEIAGDIPVTFHRAFDMVRDPYRSLEELVSLHVARILTSGLEPSVPEGLPMLKELVNLAGDRIIIMPGAGINERNFPLVHQTVGAREYHVYLHGEQPSRMTHRPTHIYMGGLLRQPEFLLQHTDAQRVSKIVSLVGMA